MYNAFIMVNFLSQSTFWGVLWRSVGLIRSLMWFYMSFVCNINQYRRIENVGYLSTFCLELSIASDVKNPASTFQIFTSWLWSHFCSTMHVLELIDEARYNSFYIRFYIWTTIWHIRRSFESYPLVSGLHIFDDCVWELC